MSNEAADIETRVIHAGEPRPGIGGAVSLPIFQSSTFEYSGEGDVSYHDLRYIRLNNTPNHQALAAKLASIENAEAAVVTGSGMAAITTTLLTVLSAGDHLLIQKGLYGGTHDFITQDLPRLGVRHSFLDLDDPSSWDGALTTATRAVYVETITNPLIEVADLGAIAEFARRHQLVSIIDNTFASPVNFRPAEWGFDYSLHSATKYLNGHTDIVAGAVIGSADRVRAVTHKLNHLGGSLDPHACFLLHRGLKTLVLRMRHQNRSALEIARFLEGRPEVARVNYAGLEGSPSHQRAARLLDGYGGMLSFELEGGVEAAKEFIRGVRIPVVAPSLGGVETLVTRPATTSHLGMPREERLAMGIKDGLVRVSVGIESTRDLVRDFQRALEGVGSGVRDLG